MELQRNKLNRFLLMCFSCITYYSCSNQNTTNLDSRDTSVNADVFTSPIDTDEIKMTAPFPFGCSDLKKWKYPISWKSNVQNDGQFSKNSELQFQRIYSCFDSINGAKVIEKPNFDKIELLELGETFRTALNLDTLMQRSIDSCRYRLPNMGIYECYYSYSGYGNLFLLNPKTKEGKLLNIYANDLAFEGSTVVRFFYIEKNEISIYHTYCYDDGCKINESLKIVVAENGEIHVDQINSN